MFRFLPLLACLIVSSAVLALETPLIVTSPGGNLSATINSSLGTMTIYAVQDGQLNRRGSANFLDDVNLLESWVVGEVNGETHTVLRTGTKDFAKPSTEEWVREVLGSIKSPKAEAAAGVQTLESRARASEKEFWAKEHPYDGVVRAALGSQYLLIVIPVKHCLLMYDVSSEKFRLVGATNFGPLLYLPHVFNSTPRPSDLLQAMPADIREAREKQIKEQMDAMIEAAEQGIQLKECDIWVSSAPTDKFIIVDIANLKLMSFEYAGKTLNVCAVRNIEVDLMVPSSFHSDPPVAGLYDAFIRDKDRKAFLASKGITDVFGFFAYIEGKQGAAAAAGKASPVQLTVIPQSGDLLIDFTDRRKIADYRFGGGNTTIELRSLRDYTFDSGIALLEAEMRSMSNASMLFSVAKSANTEEAAFKMTRSALRLYAPLHKMVEKDTKLKKLIGKSEGYEAMIEEAVKRTAQMEAEHEALIKAAAEKREAAKKKPAGGK